MTALRARETPGATEPCVPAAERDFLVDNCRAILITLVVTGHLLMTYHGDSQTVAIAHYFVYLFHIPAFAFFSGYVVTSPKRSAGRAIQTLLPLYLGMSVVHLVVRALFFGVWEWEVFTAPGLLWYLLALMIWRMSLPLIDRLRHPIVLAFAISLLAGLTDRFDTTLTLLRILVFLPFFLMGFYMPPDWERRIRKMPAVLGVLAAVLIGAVAWALATTDFLSVSAFAGSHAYGTIAHYSIARGVFSRFVALGCTMLAIFALMRLLPARRTRFSYVGKNSLMVYVLHMYFVYAFEVAYPRLGASPYMDAFVFLSPLPIVLLLASRPAVAFVSAVEGWTRSALAFLVKPA